MEDRDARDVVAAELITMRTRIEELEAARARPYHPPLIDRLGAWGGFLALIISVTTGAVTFWDDIVLRGEKQYQERVEDLRGWMTEIADMNAQITQAQASMDYNRAAALMGSLGPSKERLLNKIRPVYAENPELFTPRDRFLLANEFLAFGDKLTAAEVAEDLIGMAEGNTQLLAETEWFRARLSGLPGALHDPGVARERYALAAELTREMPLQLGLPLRLNMMNEWLQFEAVSGDCDTARDVLERYRAEVRSESVPQILAEQALNTLQLTLSQAPPRCGL